MADDYSEKPGRYVLWKAESVINSALTWLPNCNVYRSCTGCDVLGQRPLQLNDFNFCRFAGCTLWPGNDGTLGQEARSYLFSCHVLHKQSKTTPSRVTSRYNKLRLY